MSSQKKTIERRIVWSNWNLEIDDWREAYEQFLEVNGLDGDQNNEQALYEWMVETNEENLSYERINLDIQFSQPIIIIGDLGFWNGRTTGYKMIDSGNIKDCLFSDTDYTEWYVDKFGDLRADAIHHDGTNHYLYRAFKEGVTQGQIERLQEKVYEGKVTRADITRLTKRLGDEIGKIYGWDFSRRRMIQEREAR